MEELVRTFFNSCNWVMTLLRFSWLLSKIGYHFSPKQSPFACLCFSNSNSWVKNPKMQIVRETQHWLSYSLSHAYSALAIFIWGPKLEPISIQVFLVASALTSELFRSHGDIMEINCLSGQLVLHMQSHSHNSRGESGCMDWRYEFPQRSKKAETPTRNLLQLWFRILPPTSWNVWIF